LCPKPSLRSIAETSTSIEVFAPCGTKPKRYLRVMRIDMWFCVFFLSFAFD